MGSWYDQGYEGARAEAEKRELGFGPDRLWMKPDTTKQVVFVDDIPFCLKEHSWKDGNGKYQHATCLAKVNPDGCPADGAKGVQDATYIGFLTMVDLTGYVTKDGEEKKHQLILFTPKIQMMNKLRTRKETRGSLVGCMYNLSRSSKEAASAGDDIEFVREVKMEGLFPLVTYKGKNLKEMIEAANNGDAKAKKFLAHNFQIPEDGDIPLKIPAFNYANLLAPMAPADLKAAISSAQPMPGTGGGKKGGGQAVGSGSTSEDTPF